MKKTLTKEQNNTINFDELKEIKEEHNKIYFIPVWKKLNLTFEEASAYSNIGINKLRSMADEPCCPFVLYIGNRKLIKRREFEKYLEKVTEV